LGSLAALFGTSAGMDKGHDSDKLMDLYWNRAELKKAFAEARNEQFRLKDRIKQQEGATARVQQKLDHIESLLLEPNSAYNVLVFYFLRGLAHRCESKLAGFAEQLKRQREKRQHESLMSTWHASLERDSAAYDERLLAVRAQIEHAEEDIATLSAHLAAMGFFKRMFRRRSVNAEIRDRQQVISSAQDEQQTLLANIAAINDRAPPDAPGLDTGSKRSINLLILAFAQQLYLQFSDPAFANLVKESMEKSAGGVNYGSQLECKALLEQIQKRIDILDRSTDHATVLQRRAKLIGEKAMFDEESDVVPIPDSVATVFDFDESGRVVETHVPILVANYWGVSRVLSR